MAIEAVASRDTFVARLAAIGGLPEGRGGEGLGRAPPLAIPATAAFSGGDSRFLIGLWGGVGFVSGRAGFPPL